jgi:hypothetical protein
MKFQIIAVHRLTKMSIRRNRFTENQCDCTFRFQPDVTAPAAAPLTGEFYLKYCYSSMMHLILLNSIDLNSIHFDEIFILFLFISTQVLRLMES